jgi:GNAT superfamily N-acetyltransferase
VVVWYPFGDATVARERNVYGDADLITAACRAAQAHATRDPSAKLDDVYVRLDDLDAALTYRQPVGAHHQVALLGVHPSSRRRGVATGLLQHHAAHLDAAGSAAYVVATSAEGRDLFTRHGYRDSWPVVPLPAGPPLWPMWREPHPERPAHQLNREPGTASSDRGGPE